MSWSCLWAGLLGSQAQPTVSLIILPRQILHLPFEASLVTSVLRDTHPLCQGAVQEGKAPAWGGVQTDRLRGLKGHAGGRRLGQSCRA